MNDNLYIWHSKVTRVHAASPFIEGGRILLPEGESRVGDFMSEMQAFPAGKHDEQFDCLTGAIKETLRDEGILMVGYNHRYQENERTNIDCKHK